MMPSRLRSSLSVSAASFSIRFGTLACGVLGLCISSTLCGRASAAGVPTPAAAATPSRPQKDILKDLEAAFQDAFKMIYYEQLVDPKYREAFSRQHADKIQRHLDLTRELEKTERRPLAGTRTAETTDLALLDLLGRADAAEDLAKLSQSKMPAQAVMGKAGLLMKDWWTAPDTAVQQKDLEQFRALARENPTDDVLTPVLLTVARYGAASDELANGCRDLVESSLKGPAAVKYKARPDKLGRPLVVTGTTLQGKSFTTADWKGKVVVIDFWATWCPPCREALPKVAKLYQDNHARGLEVVGVDNDPNKIDVQKFLTEQPGVVWPQLFAPLGAQHWHALAQRFGVSAIPTMYVIDRNGVLRDIETGRIPDIEILKLLDEEPKPASTTQPASAQGTPAARPLGFDAPGGKS